MNSDRGYACRKPQIHILVGSQIKVAKILCRIPPFKMKAEWILSQDSPTATIPLVGSTIVTCQQSRIPAASQLLRRDKLRCVLLFPAASKIPDTPVSSKPLKWVQKLDNIWSWFLDRNKGPSQLNQGHGGTVGRIRLALHLVGPMEPSLSFQTFPYDPGPESSGPFSRSLHALSTLTQGFDLDFIYALRSPSMFQGYCQPAFHQLDHMTTSTPMRWVVHHQECSA